MARYRRRARQPVADGLAVGHGLAAALMLLGRVEEARPVVAAALAEDAPVAESLRYQLVEAMSGCAGAAWSVNAWDVCRAVNDRIAPLAAQLGDADLDVVADAMRCVPELAATDPVELAALAGRAAAVHERAVALDNVCATWMACAVLNNLRANDHRRAWEQGATRCCRGRNCPVVRAVERCTQLGIVRTQMCR